jgi:hypothetical protein
LRTNEEILERYASEDSFDIFNAQRTALLCMLPYEVAKPRLDPVYVEKHEKGELLEDEVWKDGWDIKDQILDYLPHMYKSLKARNTFELSVGVCYLKTWVWAEDPTFYDVIHHMFEVDNIDGKIITDAIAKHYGYEDSITDIPFEEINTDEDNETTI